MALKMSTREIPSQPWQEILSHVVHVEQNLFIFLTYIGIPIFIKILPESAISGVTASQKFKKIQHIQFHDAPLFKKPRSAPAMCL